jgi:hypothetical protein
MCLLQNPAKTAMDSTDFKEHMLMMIREVIDFNGCYDELLDVCVNMWSRLSPSDKNAITEKLKHMDSTHN